MLTIRDIQSQEQFSVPPEGAVLGREGGGADILVRDKSVSKRHAKVYERGGKWFLEDLQSANGTYVDEQPVTRPVNMRPGMSFSLSNYHFEVVGLEAGGSSAPTKAKGGPPPKAAAMADEWDADGGYPDETAPPPEDEWAPEVPAKGNRAPLGKGAKKNDPKPANGKSVTGSGPGKAKGGGGGGAVASAQRDFDEGAGGIPAQIPKAIAHYLKAAPLLLFNPVGFIRGSIDDMKWPAMKPMELLPWGLVAALFNVGIGIGGSVLGTVTGMIRAKSFDVGAIIALVVANIVGIVVAIVVAVVSAFIFHPLMGFIIKLLKGESDEVSRSNYYICVMTGYVLMGLPLAAAGLSQPLSLVPAVGGYLAGVIPILAGVIGQFYMLLIAFFWWRYFNVIKIIPILILVAGVANAAFGLLGVVNVLRGGGGGGTVAAITMTPEEITAFSEAQAAMASGKELTAEQQAALAKGQAAAAAAAAAAGVSVPTTDSTGSTGSTGTEATPTPAASTGDDDDDAGSAATATPVSTQVASAKTPVPVATPRTGGTTGVSVAPIAGGLTPYQKWAAKRDAIEKAIADDPTILKTNAEVFKLYTQYHRYAYAAKNKYAKQAKDPALGPVVARMIDAETFETSGGTIDQLYTRISSR